MSGKNGFQAFRSNPWSAINFTNTSTISDGEDSFHWRRLATGRKGRKSAKGLPFQRSVLLTSAFLVPLRSLNYPSAHVTQLPRDSADGRIIGSNVQSAVSVVHSVDQEVYVRRIKRFFFYSLKYMNLLRVWI